jgi:integrase
LNGKRTKFSPLDPKIPVDDLAGARECARVAHEFLRRGGAVPKVRRETVREWFGRMHASKQAKGLATVKDMRGRAARWVFPVFGDKGMCDVTRVDGERLVGQLDAAVAGFMKNGPGNGRLAPSTAANVWGDVQHAFDEAVNAKDPRLRVLHANPLHGVRGPDGGESRQGQILYSDELLALLRGEPAADRGLGVPLYRRLVYAMAVYTKARASELEALTAADVDLKHQTITIAKQSDPTTQGRKGTKQTKTKRIRAIDIEPNLFQLVADLVAHPQGKGTRLLHMPPPEDRAKLLRKDLRKVGVTRAALFVEHDPLQRAIVFHDLRDTGLTHMAVRGDSPILIQWAGGHTDFKTTQSYIARGQTERRRIGDPLPPLPPDLLAARASLGCVSDSSETIDAKFPFSLGNVVTPTGIEVGHPSNDHEHHAAIVDDGAGGIAGDRSLKCLIGGGPGRTGTNDEADSSSGLALAEEGQRRALALGEELVAAIRSGDIVTAGELARALAALLAPGGVARAI